MKISQVHKKIHTQRIFNVNDFKHFFYHHIEIRFSIVLHTYPLQTRFNIKFSSRIQYTSSIYHYAVFPCKDTVKMWTANAFCVTSWHLNGLFDFSFFAFINLLPAGGRFLVGDKLTEWNSSNEMKKQHLILSIFAILQKIW